MSMLAELVEVVIGVDTHADSHTAAVLEVRTGAVLARVTVSADADGYTELVALVEQHSGLRAWAMEGTGGHGAGLARHLADTGELVVELDRPKRPARRAAPGRSPIRSTPNAPPATHSPAPIWPSPRPGPSARPCRCG
jgi:transposase